MPIISDAIRDIVAKFGDSDWYVRNTAINCLAQLAKYGNYCDFYKRPDRTKLIVDDICERPIMSQAIKDIVAKFGDSDWHVRDTAINGLAELAKHGNLYSFFE